MNPVGMDDQQSELAVEETSAESFHSAEARYAFERARRLRFVLRSALAVLFLAGFGWGMYRLGRGGGEASATDDHHGHDGEDLPALDIPAEGSPEAKVQVLCIVPAGTDCHSSIIKFLSNMAKQEPDKIFVEFRALHELSQEEIASKIGMECAAVLVNGRAEFRINHGEQDRTISLVGTAPTHYSLMDVGMAVTHVFTDIYGPPEEPLYVASEDSHTHIDTVYDEAQAQDEGGLELSVPGFREVEDWE